LIFSLFLSCAATYFYQNGNAGACGWYKSDSDLVVAVNGITQWTDYSQASPDCGRYVTIVNESNGKTVTAQVTDVCPSCTGNGQSIDLSVGAFQAIADMSQGQVDIKWKFD
jgi:expansin (peptidoglycan-binding protein)